MGFEAREEARKEAGPRCAICAEVFRKGDMVACESCETPHHSSCFEYNRRCGTYGCRSRTSTTRIPASLRASVGSRWRAPVRPRPLELWVSDGGLEMFPWALVAVVWLLAFASAWTPRGALSWAEVAMAFLPLGAVLFLGVLRMRCFRLDRETGMFEIESYVLNVVPLPWTRIEGQGVLRLRIQESAVDPELRHLAVDLPGRRSYWIASAHGRLEELRRRADEIAQVLGTTVRMTHERDDSIVTC